MIIFREKWLWALCLAILVHVGFFFIFYMNVNKEDSLPVTNSRIDMAKPSVTPDIIDDLPPTIAKTYTAPDKNVNTVSSKDTTETPSTTQKNPITFAQTDDISAAQTLTEDSVLMPTKSASTLKSRAEKIKPPSPDTEEMSVSIPSDNIEALESIKTRAGLLSIDVPTQQPTIKIDKDYLSVKSEVEDINSQLSAAINEVKNRNQQKIDEAQRLRNGVDTSDSQSANKVIEQERQGDSL
ncbi:hypothetical protein [Psychrobacter sp. JB385]|uniref:hypothetical protein n=1 Tax=Psychrobacter sp. JB385 TaxID=1434841 RepID=UPI00097F3BDE|nr:hypothetical protein [Psychrobacter sp. JB385]SJN24247.1 hypothetical protein CZ794_04290 [Psychrobacter sp. JB385]